MSQPASFWKSYDFTLPPVILEENYLTIRQELLEGSMSIKPNDISFRYFFDKLNSYLIAPVIAVIFYVVVRIVVGETTKSEFVAFLVISVGMVGILSIIGLLISFCSLAMSIIREREHYNFVNDAIKSNSTYNSFCKTVCPKDFRYCKYIT